MGSNFSDEEIKKELTTVTKCIYKICLSSYADWKSKIYCNTFLAYLINPIDVIPDSEEKGFLDDLYLGQIVLKDL